MTETAAAVLTRKPGRAMRAPARHTCASTLVALTIVLWGGVAHAQVSVSVAANRASPQLVGTATTWTATATGGTAPYWYWWSMTRDGSPIAGSSDLTPNGQWVYTPQQTGTYRVCVQVWSYDGDPAVPEGAACSVDYAVVTSMTVTGVTVSANRPSPQIVGTVITFTATPTAGTGLAPYSYKWWVSDDNGGTWSVLQGWTANASQYVWTPPQVSNAWQIKATVRSTGSTNANGEASTAISFVTTPTPWVTAVSLAADRTSPQYTATTITWTATATYGTPPLYYYWTIYRNGSWFAEYDWATSHQFVWTPQQEGTYSFCVGVISGDGDPEVPEATACSSNFVVNASPTVTAVSLAPNLASPRAAGELIWWTATPSWGTPPISYKWWISTDNGANPSVLQDWTENASLFAWRPLEVRSTWRIAVEARSAGSTSSTGEASASAAFVTVASPTVTYVTVTSSSPSPVFIGTPITLTASATGGSPPLWYAWMVSKDGIAVDYQEWSTSNQLVYIPQDIGSYSFSVGVVSNNGDYTSEGEAVGSITLMAVPVPPEDAFIYDSFTSPNGTTLSGRTPELAPGGTSWLVPASAIPIVQAYQAAMTSGSGWVLATVGSGLANAVVGADIIPGTSTAWGGIVLRLTDANNFLVAGYRGELFLAQVQDGVMTDLATAPAWANAGDRHRIDVRLMRDRIEVYWDGAFKLDYTTAFQQNVTRHGLAWFPPIDATTRLDSFEISGAPIVSGPSNQTNETGKPIVPVPITALDLGGLPLTYGAIGLPSGLSVETSTGIISGTITAGVGAYTVTVYASNGTFTGLRRFKWTVLPLPPPVPPYARVFDTFTTNGPIANLSGRLPSTNWTNSPWTVVEGQTPQIEAGVVAAVGQSSSGYVIGAIESGTADGIVAVDFTSTAANRRAGLVLRMEDANNFLLLQYSGNWSAGRVDLLQRVHGVFTILKGVSVGPLTSSHRLEARIVGGSITGLLDGFALFETTANNNSWGTRHGLLWLRSIDTTTTYDNFAVTTQILPPLLPWNATCEASLNRYVIPVDRGNNTVTVDVTMPHPECQWTAWALVGSGVPWVTLAPDGPLYPQFGNGPAQFFVQNRSDTETTPRVGYGIVAGQLVTIVQAGLDVGECQYATDLQGLSFSNDGGSATITVTPLYPSCTWTVTPEYRTIDNAGWVELSDGSLHVGSGSFTVTVGRNPDDLVGRSAYLHIGTRMEFPVEQVPEQCSFELSRTDITVSSNNESFDTYVTAPNGCGWEVVANQTWLGITENPEGSGPLSFRTSVTNNPPGNPARLAIVELRHGGIARATMTVLQCPVGVGYSCQLDPGGEVSYFHTDAIGSVRLITNAGGAEVASFDYLPFGQEWSTSSSNNENALRFTGKERDQETGSGAWLPLDYFGARYYQMQTGRFTSPDDSRYANPFLPQSMNLFAYALNNPLRYLDSDGHQSQVAYLQLRPLETHDHGLDSLQRFFWDSFYWTLNQMTFINPTTVDFSAGLGDALLLGTGSYFRRQLDIDVVDQCSSEYVVGSWTAVGVSLGRSAYAQAARSGAVLARSGAEASAFRSQIRTVGRLGLFKNWRPFNAAKYTTDEALRQAAGRTNADLNRYGRWVGVAGAAGAAGVGAQCGG